MRMSFAYSKFKATSCKFIVEPFKTQIFERLNIGFIQFLPSIIHYLTDISQMAPKRRPIEGKIAVWDGIAQPDFGVLALSAAP